MEKLVGASGGDGKVSEYVRRKLFPNCGRVEVEQSTEIGSKRKYTSPKKRGTAAYVPDPKPAGGD